MTQKTPVHIDHDRSGFKQYLYETFYAPNLKPSPLKSLEECEKQARKQIDDAFDEYVNNLVDGEDLFLEKASKDEKERLNQIIQKSANESEDPDYPFSISLEDAHFLEQIARRQLAESHYKDAATLFKWILFYIPVYSPAYVGAAIAEQQLHHIDAAKETFKMGLTLMPKDSYLVSYAADFHVTINQVDRSKEILNEYLQLLKEEGLETSDDYKQMNKKLAQL